MKAAKQYIYMIGGILLVAGAALNITKWAWVPYMYTAGAFMFGAMQMLDCYRGPNFMLRRLYRQQIIGAIALMLAGVAMFACKNNEWILCLLIGCIFELYTAFRIPQEHKKEQE